MKTILELTNYIRFQLAELRTANKHHEFEHLTRQFARLRICENILPATGPVGAGGDQGRDFETYRTYLSSSPIATSSFLGIAGDKKLVFACSLEQKIKGKIKADITTICGGQEAVDIIYYFCESDLPVSQRHKLQKWCHDTFQTKLEVLDGQALSEQLTDLDVFWIAEQYLGVPSDFYPRSKSPGATYGKYKERWLTRDKKPYSYADFFQVKYGLRSATFEKEAKPDLPRWSTKMEVYLEETSPSTLGRRAAYEICVASLRGINNLTAKRGLVEKYFSDIENLIDLSDLQDATTLLSYCSSAYLHQHFDIEAEKLFGWTKVLISVIEKAIVSATGSGARANLFQLRGQAAYLQFRKGTTPVIDLDEAFDWWFRLLDEVESAPLFPLEHFADLLTIMTQVVGDNERFIKLTQRTDELLSKRSSGYIAAEKCRDRAIAYYEAKKYLQAIKQLHQAKIKWFSAETLRGSLMSMLLLSDCYQELGFIYPAKYYAAGVAFLAHHQNDEKLKRLIPKALFMYADFCYDAGEWLTFAHISQWALASHHMYDEHVLDIEKHTSLQRLFVHTAIIRTVTRRFDTELSNAFENVFSKWPIDQETRDGIESLSMSKTSYWQAVSADELWKTAQEQLAGRPFEDVGASRSIQWRALGIKWTVEFSNEYQTSAISEELVSTLQIILADFAARDLLLLPTKVLIQTHIWSGQKIEVEEVPSNEVATWRVGFPGAWVKNRNKIEELRIAVMSLAITVLGNCSTLKYESFRSEIERAFSEGLHSKTFATRPYAELYEEFLSEDDFKGSARRVLTTLFPALAFEVREHEELAWIDTDGPGYSKKRAEEFVRNRYEQAIKPIRLTLSRLLEHEDFRDHIRKLRQEGHLDWEVLILVSNICVNHRVHELLTPTAPPNEQVRVMKELMFRDERESDLEVPPTVFTQDRVEVQKNISLAAVAKTWGLELHQQTPDFAAIKQLLDVRYHNSEDDLPHNELFVGA